MFSYCRKSKQICHLPAAEGFSRRDSPGWVHKAVPRRQITRCDSPAIGSTRSAKKAATATHPAVQPGSDRPTPSPQAAVGTAALTAPRVLGSRSSYQDTRSKPARAESTEQQTLRPPDAEQLQAESHPGEGAGPALWTRRDRAQAFSPVRAGSESWGTVLGLNVAVSYWLVQHGPPETNPPSGSSPT